MPANNYLPDVLETTEAEHLATGFIFTEVRSGTERRARYGRGAWVRSPVRPGWSLPRFPFAKTE
jgi:hypothetical protein